MRSSVSVVALALGAQLARANVQTGQPDPAPAGYEQWISPIVVPAPPTTGTGNWASAVARAQEFVAGLTLEEKVNITTGIGSQGRCVGNTGAITRLGFAGFCLQDGPLGVRFADFASVFPAGVTAAATWDVDLMYARAKAMGAEFRGKGMNVALGPMTNLARIPAAGRNWEGFGGDPYFSGIMSAATVKGLQEQNVMACTKHFIAQEQEHSRATSSSNIDDRTLHEVQAWPFADAIHAGSVSIMQGYNRVNQTYDAENSKLINDILKKELGFQGFVLSDWAATMSGVSSALAGLDMNMPGFRKYSDPPNVPDPANSNNSWWGAYLVEAVNNGSVPIERVDDMVTRSFAAYYYVGQDKNFPELNFDGGITGDFRNGVQTNFHVNVQGNHRKIIREIGAAATVLVKNVGNALPLKLKGANAIRRLGIFGSDAGPRPGGPNGCTTGARDNACDEGTLAMGWGSGTASFPYLIDPLSAINNYVYASETGATVEGVLDDYAYPAVNTVASHSDACIVFANADSGEKYLTVAGNEGDRNNLTLWHSGDDLIQRTASVCSNTIVVLHTVGAVIVEPWINNPNVTAVLFAHLPGQETGNAIVDVLFGAVNPSGRMPYTVGKQREDYPADINLGTGNNVQITYTEGLNIDYRHFDSKGIEPRFEYGFGLSYTKFAYSNLKLTSPTIPQIPTTIDAPLPPGGHPELWQTALNATFTVKNSGAVDGHEVAQLYLGFPESAGEPPKLLRGFARKFIKKGQSTNVKMALRVRDLAVWDVVLQAWVIPEGEFTVFVGASSRDVRLTAKFTV